MLGNHFYLIDLSPFLNHKVSIIKISITISDCSCKRENQNTDIRILSPFIYFVEKNILFAKITLSQKFVSKLSIKQTTGLHMRSLLAYIVLLCTVNIDHTHSDCVAKTTGLIYNYNGY